MFLAMPLCGLAGFGPAMFGRRCSEPNVGKVGRLTAVRGEAGDCSGASGVRRAVRLRFVYWRGRVLHRSGGVGVEGPKTKEGTVGSLLCL